MTTTVKISCKEGSKSHVKVDVMEITQDGATIVDSFTLGHDVDREVTLYSTRRVMLTEVE